MLKESIVGFDPTTGRVNHAPHQIFLESSSRCNLKCVHCSTDFGVPENEGIDMSLEIVRRLAPWFESTRFINLNGIGEPLLAANFQEVIELCSRGNAELSFNTNGMLLSPQRCDSIVAAGVNSVAISVDGWETHESVRGVPYETVRNRIVRLGEAKTKAGRNAEEQAAEGQLGSASKKYGCIDPFFQIQIQSNGNLVACCYGLAAEGLNVLETDLDDIWNGTWYRRLRQNLYKKAFLGKCQNCPLIFGSVSTQVDSLRPGVYHSQNDRFHAEDT